MFLILYPLFENSTNRIAKTRTEIYLIQLKHMVMHKEKIIVEAKTMALPVMEFQDQGYKIIPLGYVDFNAKIFLILYSWS